MLVYCWFIYWFNVSIIFIQAFIFKCDKREYSQEDWTHQEVDDIKETCAICGNSCESRAQHWNNNKIRKRTDQTYERRQSDMKTEEHKLLKVYETI